MKKRFYKLAATVLAFLILVLPGALSARERRGAYLVITLKDGQQVKGELIAVKPDSLLLLNFAGTDQSVDLVGIRSIRIDRKSKAVLGGACGALAGALILGLSAASDPLLGGPVLGFFGEVLGGVGGGIIGLGAGALAGIDKTIQFEWKSELDRARALAYLRNKARIHDYK